VQRSIAASRPSSFVTWTYGSYQPCYDARRSRLRKKEIANDDRGDAAPRPARLERSCSTHGAGARARQAHATPRDVFLLYEVEGSAMRRSPDAGDDRDGLEEHAFSARRISA